MIYSYITDFHKSRQARIGASDIAWCIPHPEIQVESLAAYTDSKGERHACTALDLYNEKVHGKVYEYSFPAEMGHYLEGRALYEFISDNISYTIANDFFRGYQMHKLEQGLDSNKYVNPEIYNYTCFKHNTEAFTEWGIAHTDCIYDPEYNYDTSLLDLPKKVNELGIIKKNDLIINLSESFLLEAKSARLYTVSARKTDPYKGYDLSLKHWQGIPLKIYFQIQYQMFLYQVDVCYLALIFDTSEKHYWQITANRKHQEELVTLATYMKNCIDTKTEPKKLVMNSKDIIKMYPEIIDDFREIQGDELKEILEVAKLGRQAAEKEKNWKAIKEDAVERMALHLKDTEQIKGLVGGSLQTIAKWKNTGGGFRIRGLGEIEKHEDAKRLIRYMKKNELIYEAKRNRIPNVVIKLEELEEL